MASEQHKNDLPLMANSHEIQVRHFLLDEWCDPEKQIMKGCIYLWLKSSSAVNSYGHQFSIKHQSETNLEDVQLMDNLSATELSCEQNSGTYKNFNLILDSRDIVYHSVEELINPGKLIQQLELGTKNFNSEKSENYRSSLRSCVKHKLCFSKELWCLKIWKPGVSTSDSFPKLIKISYETIPSGASLRWSTDQDGNACVYSAAMWINNRSMFPCQEYGCFSTWQAWISVPSPYVVLMSGDAEEVINKNEDGSLEYYYYCSMPMPSFTLAIAVGKWECFKDSQMLESRISDSTCQHNPACDITFSKTKSLPWRIFAPSSLLKKAASEFSAYLKRCSEVIQDILGPSPFPRMDIMIYPRCSQDMALTNPSLMFLSQSMLCGDQSLCIKLSHEISHYWFGLLIGAKDWTEEWLSEGFATFIEDIVHARVQQWSEVQLKEHSELRALLRYHNLSAELENTQEDLQTLRPNRGKDVKTEDNSVMYVKDGINPRKQFTQVHYLKGYFLLRYLCDAIGVDGLCKLLKDYVVQYHGHMVLSQDFIKLVIDRHPELLELGITETTIYRDWLDNAGMPKELQNFESKLSNSLHKTVMLEVQKWKDLNKRRSKSKGKKLRKIDVQFHQGLEGDQQVLLLEMLLMEERLTNGTLEMIKETYHLINKGNPEVRHRWCELVIKHKCCKYYEDVRYFLLNHQAMGVYLYGELIISRCKKQRQLAEECFDKVSEEMETGTKQTVHMMIYGT